MKLKEFIERVGQIDTGRAIAYLKDGLEEIAMMEVMDDTFIKQDLREDEIYYNYPVDALSITDIQVQGHDNSDSEFKSIPRLSYESSFKDVDDV
jgi:hypothetical protein